MIASPVSASNLPPVVTREEWQEARQRLLVQEKALTRLGDLVAAQRRRLPMVEITNGYVFDGPQGPVSLLDLFEGRPQLILQHFMFHPDWDAGCDGCSMMADYLGPLAHLHARRTSFAMVSRAPVAKLEAYRERMGWAYPWVSSHGTTFNEDFGVTVDDEEDQGISVFLRDGNRVFHTWQTNGRGVEAMITLFRLLDLTPFGRQEDWEDTPPGRPQDERYGWWRRHDEYDAPVAGCCHHD